MEQVDIFGETQSLEPKPMPRDASVPQCVPMRLFEPQMEGQLALEVRTAPEGADRGATTEREDTS